MHSGPMAHTAFSTTIVRGEIRSIADNGSDGNERRAMSNEP